MCPPHRSTATTKETHYQASSTTVNGRDLVVVGILLESSLDPEAEHGILYDPEEPALTNPLLPPSVSGITVRAVTASDAAQQVGSQLALALDPTAVHDITVEAPPGVAGNRAQIEATVSTALAVLSVVAVIAAVISLMNSMSMSVLQRTRESGSHRARGARASHLRRLVLTEALFVGVSGGVTGLFLGLLGVLGFSLVRGWAPVFEPLLAPAAVVCGVLVAILAGLVAAARAGRIHPVEALRL